MDEYIPRAAARLSYNSYVAVFRQSALILALIQTAGLNPWGEFDAGIACRDCHQQCRRLRAAGGILPQRKGLQRKDRSAAPGELRPMSRLRHSIRGTRH